MIRKSFLLLLIRLGGTTNMKKVCIVCGCGRSGKEGKKKGVSGMAIAGILTYS